MTRPRQLLAGPCLRQRALHPGPISYRLAESEFSSQSVFNVLIQCEPRLGLWAGCVGLMRLEVRFAQVHLIPFSQFAMFSLSELNRHS